MKLLLQTHHQLGLSAHFLFTVTANGSCQGGATKKRVVWVGNGKGREKKKTLL